MPKSKFNKLPSFKSLDKLVEFFDTHDMGEYQDQMPEVHFEVDIKKRRHLFTIDGKLADKVAQIAMLKKIPSEALINSWLREKIREQGKEG
jgi:hypothetical protein